VISSARRSAADHVAADDEPLDLRGALV